MTKGILFSFRTQIFLGRFEFLFIDVCAIQQHAYETFSQFPKTKFFSERFIFLSYPLSCSKFSQFWYKMFDWRHRYDCHRLKLRYTQKLLVSFFFFIYNRNLHFTFVCHLLKFKDFFHVDSIKRQRKMKNFLCLSRHISCSLFSFKSIILLCVLHSHPFHFFHIIEIEFLLKELLSSTICTPVNQSVVKKNFYSFFLSKKCVKKFIFF